MQTKNNLPRKSELFMNCKIYISKKLIILKDEINKIRDLNDFYFNLNSKISNNGNLIGYIKLFKDDNFFQFLFYRVFTKLFFSKILFSKFKNYRISKAEVLGRLVYSGFSIIYYEEINNKFYFFVKKKVLSKT